MCTAEPKIVLTARFHNGTALAEIHENKRAHSREVVCEFYPCPHRPAWNICLHRFKHKSPESATRRSAQFEKTECSSICRYRDNRCHERAKVASFSFLHRILIYLQVTPESHLP